MGKAIDKYNREYEEIVKVVDKNFSDIKVGQKMLISSPRSVAGAIRDIPVGSQLSMKELRIKLASDAGADNTCPITTGIFLRVAVEALMEAPDLIKPLPYWRVIDENHPLIGKLNIPPEYVAEMRQSEGLE